MKWCGTNTVGAARAARRAITATTKDARGAGQENRRIFQDGHAFQNSDFLLEVVVSRLQLMHDGQQIQRQQLPLRRLVLNAKCISASCRSQLWSTTEARLNRLGCRDAGVSYLFPRERGSVKAKQPLHPSAKLLSRHSALWDSATSRSRVYQVGVFFFVDIPSFHQKRLRWKLPSDNALLQSCESTLYDEEHKYVKSWSRSAEFSCFERPPFKNHIFRCRIPQREGQGHALKAEPVESMPLRLEGASSPTGRSGRGRSFQGVQSVFGLLNMDLRKLLDVGSERPLRDPGTAGPAPGSREIQSSISQRRQRSGPNCV